MKYAVRLRNENGKEVKLAGNGFIDIEIIDGNKRIERLTLREGSQGVAVFNLNGDDIASATGNDNK